ncbi:outer membrane protein assembly factor BamB family protein [Deinococcus aquaedulcis]|uniref:outer membrane protein assembly factor BamB family protein n=1 Tax=Deinococcus aquaedulcis TaxID=2840455 RepID=UPI001C82B3B2|nr:PQQ-binding-like beta-propeller repeat protein [Deinococcus aquaedulcis]
MLRSLLTLTAALTLTNTHAATAERLIIADASTHELTVLDPATGMKTARFSTPGKLSGLYTGPGGTLAYAIHRDADRVTVLHSGLKSVDHGDHRDLVLGAPHVLATLNVGQQPTHFFSHDDRIAIFNDRGGTVAVFGETLLGKTNDMTVVKVAQPDHGAAVLLGNVLLSGYLRLNRVDAYDLGSGALLGTVREPCPGLHGEAVRGAVAYYGCTDGVLAVTVQGRETNGRKLSNPAGTADGTRVGTIAAHEKSPALYGNFGPGLVRWSPDDTALTPVPLSAPPLKFAFAPDGQRLLALTADGQLHALDARTGRVLRSAALVAPLAADKAAVRPTFVVGTRLYVTSPTTGEVIEVNHSDLSVVRRLNVGGTPALLTLTHASGQHH